MKRYRLAAFLTAALLFTGAGRGWTAPLFPDEGGSGRQIANDQWFMPGPSPTPASTPRPVATPEPVPPPPAPTAPPAAPNPEPVATPQPAPPQPEASPGASPASAEPARRAPPQPFDSIFQATGGEFMGMTIGVPDSTPVWPLTQALWDLDPDLKVGNGVRISGWLNPSYNASSSKESNVPLAYPVAPNKFEIDQLVLRLELQPDTVQQDHVDWGFRISNLFGIDYRYTTTQGIFSQQLLGKNELYGFDPVECYGMVYIPDVAEGMVVKFGRIISPADIEAQLAPENYLFSHSLLYTYDIYTETGVFATIKFNDNWQVMFGFHEGGDVAPWNAATTPSGLCEVRWVSDDDKDSLHFGVSSINSGNFHNGHDNIQETTLNWTHVFTNEFHAVTEGYYLYSYNAYKGGTFNNGPFAFGNGGGPGAYIPGQSCAYGVVNYLEYKIADDTYLSLRNGFLSDPNGWRTGFNTTYSDHTFGMTHYFDDLVMFRPEIRYEKAYGATPYDNGTRKDQFEVQGDFIFRY